MRILIIGGTRFMGPYVVKALHAQGHEIILFHRGETNYDFHFPVTYIKGDRANLFSYKNKLLSHSPDVLIEMIAYSEKDAKQLADIFHGRIKRIIIISSCDVYRAFDGLWKVINDELISMPLTENSPLRENFFPYRRFTSNAKDWTYDYEKILVEKTIRSYADIHSTILRLPMVYGPHDYSRILPYLKIMANDQDILLDECKANWRVSRGYVEDMANAIMLAALDTRSGNKIYNVSEIEAYSEKEWIQKIGKVYGWKKKIITTSIENLPQNLQESMLDFKQNLIMDSKHIRNELSYKELYTPQDSMKISLDWLRPFA